MIFISVTGLFKELNTKDSKEHLRYFDRQFVIAPEGAGFCVHEEHLTVCNPTPAQEKKANSAALVPQPTPGPSAAPAAIVAPDALTEEMKQHMALQFSQLTKLVPQWSYDCLRLNEWNYDKAQVAFQDALAMNKIPADALMN